MGSNTKIIWLKCLLLFKMFTVMFVWGLPALTGPASFLKLLDVAMPGDPFSLRIFGAVQVSLTLL